MKIAINTNYTDKFSHYATRAIWRHFNGSFTNMDIEPDEVVDHIRQGHPYTTQHRNYRKQDNFLCAQHLATDHDNGESFEDLLKYPFIRGNAYAIHTTPSHEKDNPRTRVFYILERPIRNRKAYSVIAQALCHKFRHADHSAKDPCRFFYGCNPDNAQVKILGNILLLETAVMELVKPFKENKNKFLKEPVIVSNGNGDVLEGEVKKILSAPDGEKWHILSKVSYRVGGYCGGGAIDFYSARRALIEAIQRRGNVRSMQVAINAIDSGLEKGASSPIEIKDEWEMMGVKI